jgi:hypothetical protein
MASTDISPVTARLKNRIQTVTDIGLVYEHDIYSHDDLRSLIVSTIGATPTLRAWWISGPTMQGRPMTQIPSGHIERTWSYTLHGVEGLSANGDSLLTLRTNALAICDAIDLDRELNDTAHRTQPCAWRIGPENRVLWTGVAVSYIEITKAVVTVSTP